MLETGGNKEVLKKERGLKYSNSSMDFLQIIYLYGQVRASGSLKIFLSKNCIYGVPLSESDIFG